MYSCNTQQSTPIGLNDSKIDNALRASVKLVNRYGVAHPPGPVALFRFAIYIFVPGLSHVSTTVRTDHGGYEGSVRVPGRRVKCSMFAISPLRTRLGTNFPNHD